MKTLLADDHPLMREGVRQVLAQLENGVEILDAHDYPSLFAVAAAHEGQGVGRALLAHAERWAREHGCALLTLAVLPGNTRARALYEAAGFDTDLLRLAKPLR